MSAYISSYQSNHQAGEAYAFAAMLLEQQANIVRLGGYHALVDTLLEMAKEKNIATVEAFYILQNQQKQLFAKTEQDAQKAMAAYDEHIAKHTEPLKFLRAKRFKLEAQLGTVISKINGYPNVKKNKEASLTQQGFSKEQIIQIMSLDDALPQLQQEQQEISQELAEVVADFQGIYDTANKIKSDLFYRLSRESA